MRNIRAGKCPRYQRDIMQSTIARATRSGLRSHSDTTSYVTPPAAACQIRRARLLLWSSGIELYPLIY